MLNEMTGNPVIDRELVMEDIALLRDAPIVLSEVYQSKPGLSVTNFVDYLIDALTLQRSSTEWLEYLIAEKQFALAMRLLLYFQKTQQQFLIDAEQLGYIRKQWETYCEKEFERLQERLRSYTDILEETEVEACQHSLHDALQKAQEGWIDLARKDFELTDKYLTDKIKEAQAERTQRYTIAQGYITEVRTQLIAYERDLEANGTIAMVWELLGLADQLSIVADYDLEQIKRLCEMIRQLYTGAAIADLNKDALNQIYELLEKPVDTNQSRLIPRFSRSYDQVTPEPQTDNLRGQEKRTGSVQITIDCFNALFNMPPGILQHDLAQLVPSSKVSRNRTFASGINENFRLAKMRYQTREKAEDSAVQRLEDLIPLLRYWGGEVARVPPDEYRNVSSNTAFYAFLRAEHFLYLGVWSTAAEYYRLALKLYGNTQHDPIIARTLFSYICAYALNGAPGKGLQQELEGVKNISDLISMLFQWGWKNTRKGNEVSLLTGIIKLYIEVEWLALPIMEMIGNLEHSDLRDAFQRALKQNTAHLPVRVNSDSLTGYFELAVLTYQRLEEEYQVAVEALALSASDINSLQQFDVAVEKLREMPDRFEAQDQKLLTLLGEMSVIIQRYLDSQLPLTDRRQAIEHFKNDLYSHAKNQTESAPTSFGLQVRAMINSLYLLLDNDVRNLEAVSVPEIDVQLEISNWRSDGYYYCNLRVMNKGKQRADNVFVTIQPSRVGEYDVVADEIHNISPSMRLGAIPPSAYRPVHAVVKPRPALDEQFKLFTLNISAQFEVPGRTSPEVRRYLLRVDVSTDEEILPLEHNPYVVGGIVKEHDVFFGRDRLVDELLAEVANPARCSSVAIYGQKRSGKSTVLYYLEQKSPKFVIPVWFDAAKVLDPDEAKQHRVKLNVAEEVPTHVSDLTAFWFTLIDQICTTAEANGLNITPLSWAELSQPPSASYHFRRFLQNFKKQFPDRRLLILFDEFNQFVQANIIDGNFMKLLKSFVENELCSYVISGITEVYEVIKSYANQLAVSSPQRIDYLDEASCCTLIWYPIRIPGEDTTRFYPPGLEKEIFQLTSGNPFYTQYFCHEMVDYMMSMGINRVSAADIEAVTQRLMDGDTRIDPVSFDNLYDYGTNESYEAIMEGLVVHLIAHETATKPYASLKTLYQHVYHFVTEDELYNTLTRLEHRGTLIQETNDPTHRTGQPQIQHYRIRIEFFQKWVLKVHPISESALRSFEEKLKRARP